MKVRACQEEWEEWEGCCGHVCGRGRGRRRDEGAFTPSGGWGMRKRYLWEYLREGEE